MTTEWKLVPVEPTDEMIVAVRRYDAAFDWQGTEEFARGAWSVYLAAAPQPPPQWPDPRPMSEAPKAEGIGPSTKILAWWPGLREWVATWWWVGRGKWIHGRMEDYAPQPTHWLPMPPDPPEQETTK